MLLGFCVITTAAQEPLVIDTTQTAEIKTELPQRKIHTNAVKSTDTTTAKPSLDSVHTQSEIGTLDAAWKPVAINHSIGIRGGWGTGFIRREPTKEGTSFPYSLWNGGVSYRFDIPAQKYVGTISFDLDYMQKGYSYLQSFGSELAYAHSFDVLQLSIVWQPYLPLGRRNDSRVYLIAGPFASYTLGGREREYNVQTQEILMSRKYEMDPMNDYSFNYGITAGLGFQIAFGRFAISMDARYNIQLSDIIRGPEFIPGNPFRTPVDHVGASLGFHYNFIKAK